MFHSEFYIYSEDNDIVEFRRKESQLYFWLFVGIILFAICSLAAAIDTLVSLFIIGIGIMFLVYGIKPFFSLRKIILDKSNETLILIRAFGIFSPLSKQIKFSQINKIEIIEDYFGRGAAGPEGECAGRDKIYLDLKGKGYMELDKSYSDRYTNKFVNNLSEKIGCKVVCIR